ncbi:MAG: glycosyltransferase [Acidobacteriota bacterium]|nr:glycosyltransferase [Acidobacteriota bacterium]
MNARVSVVMSVYNGAASLAATLDSIVAQTMRDFELIAIDDGSTDVTPQILARYAAADPRIRVITQPNAGLTRALIRGCAEAGAPVIARHDCGDVSHPERLAKQLALLEQGHVVTGTAARFVSHEGDTLYFARGDGDEVRHSLLHDDPVRIHGIVHATAMFRRDAYLAAGGYRAEFRTAQDLDLWIRLAPLGTFVVTEEVLYEALFDARSISGSSRESQVRLTEIAVALRDGGDARTLLAEAAGVRKGSITRGGEAAALYFIAKCLLDQKNTNGRRYLWRAVKRNPLHWRSWFWLLASLRPR